MFGLKKFAIVLVIAAVLVVAGVLAERFLPLGSTGGLDLGNLGKTKVDENVTLSILHSEAMAFLVTRRTTTQIVFEHSESSFWGDWNGVMWATVTWQWGVDLKKITKDDLRREGDVVYCRLGEPELLNFDVDESTMRFMSKSTAVPKIVSVLDPNTQEGKMRQLYRSHARKCAQDPRLRPSREEMIQQLNGAMQVFRDSAGVDIRFE